MTFANFFFANLLFIFLDTITDFAYIHSLFYRSSCESFFAYIFHHITFTVNSFFLAETVKLKKVRAFCCCCKRFFENVKSNLHLLSNINALCGQCEKHIKPWLCEYIPTYLCMFPCYCCTSHPPTPPYTSLVTHPALKIAICGLAPCICEN